MTQLNVRLKPCYEVWHALQIAGRIMLIYTWQAYMLNPKPTHYMCLIMCCWMPFPSLSALKILYIASRCNIGSITPLAFKIVFHFISLSIIVHFNINVGSLCNVLETFISSKTISLCFNNNERIIFTNLCSKRNNY
mgnify:CR=1 FL=1